MAAICLGLNVLTHGSLWHHMGTDMLVNIGSGNGLEPDQAITWINACFLSVELQGSFNC